MSQISARDLCGEMARQLPWWRLVFLLAGKDVSPIKQLAIFSIMADTMMVRRHMSGDKT